MPLHFEDIAVMIASFLPILSPSISGPVDLCQLSNVKTCHAMVDVVADTRCD
jgi:hypothetical protein